jgi:hypothetical protein
VSSGSPAISQEVDSSTSVPGLVELSTKSYDVFMPAEPKWLDSREDRAWRAFVHAGHQLTLRLNRHLVQDSGMTEGDYPVLSVLSEHTTGRMSARELCALLQWA